MSTSVDTRLVQMKFDNSEFQKKIHGTIRTLAELDRTLKLDRLERTVSKMSRSINEDFDKVGDGIENLASRLGPIKNAITETIDWIGNKIKSAVGVIPNFITEAIIGGGKTRAQNIEHAKFVIEGLGESWDKYYDAFNNSVVGTAYGLDQAAAAGSQLIASGMKDVGKLESALKSIAGVAAMTGSDYESIAHHFTTIASQGYVMGAQLTLLSQAGLNAKAALKDYINEENKAYNKIRKKGSKKRKTDLTEADIADMVSKKQISADKFYKAMEAQYGESAAKANETFSGAMSNLRAAFARIGAEFFTPLMENARDLFNTLRPIVDLIKNAILPNIKEFNEIETEVFQDLIKGFDESGVPANTLIKSVKNLANSAIKVVKAIKPLVKAITDAELLSLAFKTITDGLKAGLEIIKIILRGLLKPFGRISASLKETIEFIDELILKFQEFLYVTDNDSIGKKFQNAFEHVGNAIANIVSSILMVAKPALEGFFSAFGIGDIDSAADELENFTESLDELSKKLTPTENDLENIRIIFKGVGDAVGIIGDVLWAVIKGFKTLGKTEINTKDSMVDMLLSVSKSVTEFRKYLKESGKLDKITETTGKTLKWLNEKVLTPLLNLAPKTYTKFTDWWKDTFGDATVIEVFSDALSNAKDNIEKALDYLQEAFEKITGKTPKEAFDDILKFFKDLPDTLNTFWNTVTGKDFKRWFRDTGDSIVDFLANIRKGIQDLFGVKDDESVKSAVEMIGGIFTTLSDIMIPKDTKEGITNLLEGTGWSFDDIFGKDDIDTSKLETKQTAWEKFVNFVKNLISKLSELISWESLIKNVGKVMDDINPILKKILSNIKLTADIVTEIVGVLSLYNFSTSATEISGSFAALVESITKKPVLRKNTLQSIVEPFKKLLKALSDIILNMAIFFAVISFIKEGRLETGMDILEASAWGVMAIVAAIAIAAELLSNGKVGNIEEFQKTFKLLSGAMTTFGATMIEIAAAAWILSNIPAELFTDVEAVIGVSMVAIVLILFAMTYIAEKATNVQNIVAVLILTSIAMLSFGASMLMICEALSKLSSIDEGQLAMSLAVIITVGTVIAGLMFVAAVIGSMGWQTVAAAAVIMAVAAGYVYVFSIAITKILEALSKMDLSSIDFDSMLEGIGKIFLLVLALSGMGLLGFTFAPMILLISIAFTAFSGALFLLGKAIDYIIPSLTAFIALCKSLVSDPIDTERLTANLSDSVSNIDINKVKDIVNRVLDIVVMGITMTAMKLSDAAHIILPILIQLFNYIRDTILNNLKETIEKVYTTLIDMTSMVESIIDNTIDIIFNALTKILIKLANFFKTQSNTVKAAILPVIDIIFDVLSSFFAKLWPFLDEQLPKFISFIKNLWTKINELIDEIAPECINLIFKLLDIFFANLWPFLDSQLTNLGTFLDSVNDLILDKILLGIFGLLGVLSITLDTAASNLFEWLDGQIENVGGFIDNLLEYLNENVGEWSNELVTILFDILIGGINGVKEKIPELADSIDELLLTTIDTVTEHVNGDKASEYKNHIKEAVKSIIDFFKEMFGINDIAAGAAEFVLIGESLITGLINGMSNKMSDLSDTARDVGKTVLETIRKKTEVHSPSKATEKIGGFLAKGLSIGMLKGESEVKTSSESLSETALNGLKKALSSITEGLFSDEEGNPTITPVLDLSNIEDGLGDMTTMFNDANVPTVSVGKIKSYGGHSSDYEDYGTSDYENQNGSYNKGKVIYFTQNNYSPKHLSRKEIYRNTKNMISTQGRVGTT